MEKPCSQASERNKHAILEVLKPIFRTCTRILEIGSGTGQHAVYFAAEFPNLHWQTSDLVENHDAINAWIEDSQLDNVSAPVELDVDATNWQLGTFDSVYSANTAHIMRWDSVIRMITGSANLLQDEGAICLYGPFNYGGQFTSPSNAEFDKWLKSVAPHQGIRDFEAICEIAEGCNMRLESDFEMPANNRLLVFRKARRPGIT